MHIQRIQHRVMDSLLLVALVIPSVACAQQKTKWVTTWAASSQGPYPAGSSVALPDQSFAFPVAADGANDQSFRMIVRPSVWAKQTRVRFSNAFGTKPVKLNAVFVGLQLSSATVVHGTNMPVLFSGKRYVSIAPGSDVWSDLVSLPFVPGMKETNLAGRKLAVSFHVDGISGPMTWHAKALQTSYASLPQAGSHGGADTEDAFPLSTTAWFFLSAVDMRMPGGTPLVVCFGDSITDGTNSTLNGDDRWPDFLQRSLGDRYPNGVAVVDTGIGSNQITGPEIYSLDKPTNGGPSALQRINRDVASLSGVTTIIWFEGINDLSRIDNPSAETVVEGYRTGIAALRKAIPGVRVLGATITPSLGAKGNSGTEAVDQKRKAVNQAIRAGGLFDDYFDFERAVLDPQSGGLKAEFVPNSTIGGAGDKLHPNRAGYMAIARTIRLDTVLPGFDSK
jgi:lysophospholipase L1-like esterase